MTEEEIRQAVFDLYLGIFGREPDPGGAEHMANVLGKTGDLAAMLHDFVSGDEGTRRRQRERELLNLRQSIRDNGIDDHEYRVPAVLSRPGPPTRRILLVGSCLMGHWVEQLHYHDPDLEIERITFNNASALQEMTKEQIRSYDFQIVQIPLRSIVMEPMYLKLKQNDEAGWQESYELSRRFLKLNVEAALAYNRQAGIRSFVLNLPLPQQNPVGRLQPRYALNNLVHYIEELNRELYEMVAAYSDVHMIDFDQIIATYGRKYFQDDHVSTINHGSAMQLGIGPIDAARLEPMGDLDAMYIPRIGKVVTAAFEEARAMDRTIRQQDSVKIAIFDLDDTLWRGIVAEIEDIGEDLTEGWPIGIIEAVSMLWRRGILVAIVSKNDEERTRANWQKLYGRDFPIENFAAVKIGWEPKPLAIQKILEEVNLLPGNAIFIDDNPVERAGVLEAFPEIRVIGGSPLEWRRILLWSAETQVATITSESAARTEMIQAQIRRTTEESTMDRSAFLASLDLSVAVRTIKAENDPQFARALELLNKTNQFNTTGRRWQQAELADLFAAGGYLLAGTVSDRFVDYGLVALAIVSGDVIEQYVMSCRVFGMEVEQTMVAAAVSQIAMTGHDSVKGRIVPTEKNKLSVPLFSANGFEDAGEGLWRRPASGDVTYPAHVRIAA